jgi:hypothetical protein
MVFGLVDLFTSDQEPHIGEHQVLRSSPTSGVKLCQGDLRGRQTLFGSFFTDGQRSFIVASPIGGTRKQRCDQRLGGTGLAERHEQQFDRARDYFLFADKQGVGSEIRLLLIMMLSFPASQCMKARYLFSFNRRITGIHNGYWEQSRSVVLIN